MPTVEQDIAEIWRILRSGLGVNQLDPIESIQSNDLFPFYSASDGKMVRITYSNLLDLLASGDITFIEEDDGGDPPTLTGRILIQQAGITKVIIGKAAQSNQYSDLDGKPTFATKEEVDQAETDANTYTDNQIALLDYNEFKGDFDIGGNTPDLQDSTGFLNEEYRVVNAASQGTVKDFGSGDILLKNDDIIIFDGTNWEIKVDNNQSQPALLAIPPSDTSPVSSSVLNNRMTKIFNLSGYRLTNIGVEGILNISNISTSTFCFFANGGDRFLLVDFSNLDEESNSLLSVNNRIFNISTAISTNSATNDIIGEIKNQAIFNTNKIASITGVSVPSNYTIFKITQSFSTFFSGLQSMNISLDLVGDLNQIITKKISFIDQDFIAASPIELLPSPGVDNIYELIEVSASQNLNTAYSNNSFLVLRQGVNYATILLKLDEIGKYYFKLGGLGFSGGNGGIGDDIQNKPLEVSVGSDAINGVGQIDIYIRYRIRNLWQND